MPAKKTRIPFEPGKTYHVYNRGNNREKLFFTNKNYENFLNIYSSTVNTLVDTFAYCLIPNHFHFLIRLNEDTSYKHFNIQLRRWLIKYVLQINSQENRTGALFTRPVNRLPVEDETYFKDLIYYINTNPLKHNVIENYQSYAFSSYLDIVNGNERIVYRKNVLNMFNYSVEEFVEFHKSKKEIALGKDILLEQ